MGIGQYLRGRAQLNMAPSQGRSALVASLLKQSMDSQGRGSMSPVETLNIAAKPILAALLAKQEDRARDKQVATDTAMNQALAGALSRSGQEGPQGEAAKRAAMIIAGGQPQNPMAQELMSSQIRGMSPQPPERRVHSAQILSNGNIGYLDAFSGQVVDTGQKASESFQILETPGGAALAVNRRTGEQGGQIVSPEEGISQAAQRAGAERSASERAAMEAKLRTELPAEFSRLDEELRRNETMLKRLEGGEISTGPVVGRIPALTTTQQEFDAFSGEDVVSRISEATFGQLSEGERKFLQGTVPSRDKTVEANTRIIQRRINILRRGQERVREQMDDFGIDPRKTDTQGTSGVPNVGDVIDGYTFKGGDPSDPSNWSKQ